jgi:phenylacetate-CoA ligase
MSRTAQLEKTFYDALMDSEHWSRERLLDLQRTNLARLLRHARAEVPFYSDRLNPLFTPSGDIDWNRWEDIPIIKRRDLVDHRDAMQARHLPSGHGPTGVARTSGSTGLAVEVTGTALQVAVDSAARWRGLGRTGVDWSKNVCSRQEIDPEKARWPEGALAGRFGPHWLEGPRGYGWSLYKGTPAEQTFEFIRRHECAYLNVGAKTAHALSIEARRLGIEVRLQAVLAQGENCDEHDRDACRSTFGAAIIELYSSKEMGQGAHPCEYGSLHVNDENVLIEIVDEADRACPPGTQGRVIVTPFYSTAQPLIRYEQGDIAIFGEMCACGRQGHVIERIVGRAAAIFRHPDGRAVSRLLPGRARKHLSSEMVQIAQTGPTNYEIRYVPVGDGVVDEAAFQQVFREEYFDDALLTFVPLRELPTGASGKVAEYVNEYHRAS